MACREVFRLGMLLSGKVQLRFSRCSCVLSMCLSRDHSSTKRHVTDGEAEMRTEGCRDDRNAPRSETGFNFLGLGFQLGLQAWQMQMHATVVGLVKALAATCKSAGRGTVPIRTPYKAFAQAKKRSLRFRYCVSHV